MANLDACSISLGFDAELVESQDGETDFVAAHLTLNGKEFETLIIPVEPE